MCVGQDSFPFHETFIKTMIKKSIKNDQILTQPPGKWRDNVCTQEDLDFLLNHLASLSCRIFFYKVYILSPSSATELKESCDTGIQRCSTLNSQCWVCMVSWHHAKRFTWIISHDVADIIMSILQVGKLESRKMTTLIKYRARIWVRSHWIEALIVIFSFTRQKWFFETEWPGA